MLLEAAKASLLLIDIQDRLLPAMAAPETVVERSRLLLAAARTLDMPVTVSEQYPKGLGPTVQQLQGDIGSAPVFAKLAFSCWRDAALKAHMIQHFEGGRPQVVVAGIEAHVCVLQTAVDLAQAGFATYVVADAVSSRVRSSVDLALDRLRQADVQVINAEMAVFELLGQAGTAAFKTLSALVR